MSESAKEGATGLPEGLDIGLGPGDRAFEPHYSDQGMIIRTTLSKRVMCSDLSFLLRIFFRNCKATRSANTDRVALDGGMAAPPGCAVPH